MRTDDRIVRLAREAADGMQQVDALLDSGDEQAAEDLDARLEEVLEELECLLDGLEEASDEDAEPEDFHEGIGLEEQFAATWDLWLHAETFVTLENVAANLKDTLWTAAHTSGDAPRDFLGADDPTLLALAESLYLERVSRRRARREALHAQAA